MASTDTKTSVGSSIRTIVVATDFSETAGVAVERACELARAHGARLVVVNSLTLDPLPLGGPELMVLPPDFETQVREASLKALSEVVERARAKGVKAEAELETGSPAAAIVAAASRLGADLLVLGTRGNTGFKHLLLGSVAEAVVRDAECPVLTVHPRDHRPLDSLRRVLIPTDFSDDARHALATVSDLLKGRVGQVELCLLHVYQLPVMVAPLSGFAPEMPILIEDARELAHKALDPQAEELRAKGFRVEVIGREGDPATAITELARSREADLIAMGTRGLSRLKQVLLGSTAERVVQHAGCPVLTIRRSRKR
jgi:nucleotide-binding universal stress UspA family protein